VKQAGYEWKSVSENVAMGQPSIVEVMKAWIESPGHYQNLINPNSRHYASAVARGNDQRLYWVQCFAAKKDW
jgi:uncharacterized protein YkwD